MRIQKIQRLSPRNTDHARRVPTFKSMFQLKKYLVRKSKHTLILYDYSNNIFRGRMAELVLDLLKFDIFYKCWIQSVAWAFLEQLLSIAVFSMHSVRKYHKSPNPMKKARSEDSCAWWCVTARIYYWIGFIHFSWLFYFGYCLMVDLNILICIM